MATIRENDNDAPDAFSTSVVLGVGDTFVGRIESREDIDLIAIDLIEGETYSLKMTAANPLLRPYFSLWDVNESFESYSFNTSDDTVDGMLFVAPETGRYFVRADMSANRVGDYTIEFETRSDYREYSLEEISEQLRIDYWDWANEPENARWEADRDGVVRISYSTELLTPEHQRLVDYALEAWEDISGIDFVKLQNDSADVLFEDAGDSNYAQHYYIGNTIAGAYVSLDDRFFRDDEQLGGFAYSVALHEIGHVLGLGHAGFYNSNGYHPVDSHFVNDNEAWTIMSYFKAEEILFADEDFWYPLTPMPGDIQAIWDLYGEHQVNSSDTRYTAEFSPFSNTAGGVIEEYHTLVSQTDPEPVTLRGVAYTIVDSGGEDTIDGRGGIDAVSIDLADGARSTISNVKGGLTIMQGSMIEHAFGSDFDDTLAGNELDNRLVGGAGADVIGGRDGDDDLFGDAGDDSISGGAGRDSVEGGAGADVLDGDAGDDTLHGNDGADTLLGADGDDGLFGGAQDDRAEGGDGDDTLLGEDGQDRLFGGAGDDRLLGGAGDDTVVGGEGRDVADLGDGNDLFADTGQSGPEGNDTAYGGAGNDTLGGGGGGDLFYGQDGADRVIGRAGDDQLFGGGQEDTLSGGSGNDAVRGGNGRDQAFLGDGNDLWIDETQTNFGADYVKAGRGDDTLNAGGGYDTLVGGEGADVFVFARQIDTDRIADYRAGTDSLQINADLWGGALNQARLDAVTGSLRGDLMLDFGDGDRIVFLGLTDNAGLLDDITLI